MRRNFIWSGQSNMTDRGVISQLPAFPNASRMFVYRRTWPWAANVPGTWEPAVDAIDEGNGAIAGCAGAVALAFLNRICELFPDDEAAVIPYSTGGISIASWAKFNRNSGQYGGMIQRALWAEDLGETTGFVFWQGESDTADVNNANNWGPRFSELVSNVRVDMGKLDLPTVFVKLGNQVPAAPFNAYWNTIRSVQDSMVMKNLAKVDIDGLAVNADKLHYPTASYVEIGVRLANAIAPML